MNVQMRRYAAGILALGLASTYGLAASAQEVIEEYYVVEEPAPEAMIEDDSAELLVADADGVQRCAEEFRSFDPSSGTYVTYAGETRICPYLE